jgi:hypothetical protein
LSDSGFSQEESWGRSHSWRAKRIGSQLGWRGWRSPVRAVRGSGPHAVSLERRQCRTTDPLRLPELTPVAWVTVLCSVKLPVVAAKRPVPPVMV